MKKLLMTAVVGVMCVSTLAQTSPLPAPKKTPFRIKIRSADPWFVKAMLESIPMTQPEVSTIPGFGGLGSGVSQGLSKLFEGGHFIVNPTDNSLWWIPD